MSQLLPLISWSGENRATIIFVHGLGGDPYLTWQYSKNPTGFWPNWLGDDLPGATVFTLAYDDPPSNWIGTSMALQDRAINVRECLLTAPLPEGPIIFICHSLGGLIIKQVILDLKEVAEHEPDAARFLAKVTEVIFVATPHTGSHQATTLDRLKLFLWPSAAARSLVANDPSLRKINTSYRSLIANSARRIRNRVFFETRDSMAFRIVDEASSDPGIADASPIPVDADHISITKPSSKDGFIYKTILAGIASRFPILGDPGNSHKYDRMVVARDRNLQLFPKLLRLVFLAFLLSLLFLGATHLLTESKYDALLREIGKERGIPIAPLKGILASLGEAGTADDQIVDRLRLKADEYIALRQQLKASTDSSSVLQKAKLTATQLLEEGRLSEAKLAFENARKEIRKIRLEANAEEATLLEREAEVANLQSDYFEAAAKVAEAAKLVENDTDRRIHYRLLQAQFLTTRGNFFGDSSAFTKALEVLQTELGELSRDNRPLYSASVKGAMGEILSFHGRRETKSHRLEDAIALFQEVDEIRSKLGSRENWAANRRNLANALTSKGIRDDNVKDLEESVAILKSLAKDEGNKDSVGWLDTQRHLASALSRLGAHSGQDKYFAEALLVLSELLKRTDKEKNPVQWRVAMTQRCSSLCSLGAARSNEAMIREGIGCWKEIESTFSRDRVPMEWATFQNNIGGAIGALLEIRFDMSLADEQIDRYSNASTVWTVQNNPIGWGVLQINSAGAWLAKASHLTGTERKAALMQARDLADTATKFFQENKTVYYYDTAASLKERAEKGLISE